jgi:hypothetical protein
VFSDPAEHNISMSKATRCWSRVIQAMGLGGAVAVIGAAFFEGFLAYQNRRYEAITSTSTPAASAGLGEKGQAAWVLFPGRCSGWVTTVTTPSGPGSTSPWTTILS